MRHFLVLVALLFSSLVSAQKYAKVEWELPGLLPSSCWSNVTLPVSGDRVWVGTVTNTTTGEGQVFASRIDVDGNVVWNRTYVTPGGHSFAFLPYASLGASDTIVIGASAYSLPLLLPHTVFYKIDQDGTLISSNIVGVAGDSLTGLDVGSAGNIYFTASSLAGSVKVGKLDTSLSILWTNIYPDCSTGSPPAVLSDNNIVCSMNDHSTDDVRMIRLNANGSVVYDVQFGSNGTTESERGVFASSTGETYIMFYYDRGGANQELRLRQVDPTGNGVWTVVSTVITDNPIVAQIPSSDLVVVGENGDGIRFVRITETGNIVWSQDVSFAGFDSSPLSFVVSSDSLISCVGENRDLGSSDTACMAVSLTPTGELVYKWQGTESSTASPNFAQTASPVQSGGLLVGALEVIDGLQHAVVRRLQAELNVFPLQATVRLGRLNSGNLVSLPYNDDNYYEVCKFIVPNQATPPINVEFTSLVGPDYPANNMEFNVVSKAGTTGLRQNVELWNWNTGAWERSNQQNMTLNEQSSTTTGSVATNMQSGTRAVKARIQISVTGLVLTNSWCVKFDQATWFVRP